MDFANRLDMLLEVADCGSFAKAADRKHIDRSVLSKQIKKLEDTLGVRLLNRSTRSLSLTPAGMQIIEQARKSRDILNETRYLAETFHSEPKGKLKISSAAMFGRRYIQPAIIAFMKKYPNTKIELILDDHRIDMIGKGFDIVFRIGPLQDSNLVAKKLVNNGVILLASQDFIAQHGEPKTPEELVKLPSIIYSSDDFIADKLRISHDKNSFETTTYIMNSNYFVNDSAMVIDAAKAGLGYARIAKFVLKKHIKKQGLVQLLTDYHLPDHGDIYAMYAHRNHSPLVRLFIDSVQDVIGKPAIWESYLT